MPVKPTKALTPPGPKSFLGLADAKDFANDTLGFILRMHREYGDVVRFRMGPFLATFFYHPDAVREILATHWKKLPKERRQKKVLAQWDGNGLLLSEGDYWNRQHRLVQPAFAAKRFAGYAADMEALTQRLVGRWMRFSETQSFVIDEEMRYLTLEIISQTLFGAEVTSLTKQLERAVFDLSEISVAEMKMLFLPPRWLPTQHNRRKWGAVELLKKTTRDFIRQRRERKTDAGDLLSMLLMATDDEGDRKGMTDEQVLDEVMVLFLAGHDTTASALIWTWYCLAQHPEIEKKIVEEIQSVCGTRTPAFADLNKLKYLKQVIQEVLRLYPPAIGVFARQPVEDLTIAGYHVPKNSFVYAFSYATHRDARWFAQPEKFDPERFSPEREKSIPPFAYFPFGGGPRVCIGQNFAMMEMQLILSTLLQRFHVTIVPGQTITPTSRLSLTPADPIRVTVSQRG